ncbi:brachyurin-like [Ostrinia nubilalis]|uniref:brachyurin-like n=1 Tax=Ostrinia nubilalis TaxID=29057 RepID=UPI003082230B
MYFGTVIFVAIVASASALLEVTPSRGYHEAVGIPLAASIKKAEDEALAKASEADIHKIVGGVLAPANEHPYLAGLLIDLVNTAGQSVCGSSLLSTNRLVTAAHCWYDGVGQAWRFTVILGTQFLFWGGRRISTSEVFMHPQWNPSNLSNDVAMIYLPVDITFSNNIQPIPLPDASQLRNTYTGQWAVAAGFGRTSDSQVGASSVISHVTLQVISETQCRVVFGEGFVFPSTLCTSGIGGVGLCGGDSGGPLVVTQDGQKHLIGISSFVAANNCQGGHPSAFARVTSFMNFIQQNLW